MPSDPTKTLRQADVDLLRDIGPTHYRELTERILSQGLAASSSKTPAASLNAVIAVDIKRNGTKSAFVRVKPGVFGLRELHAAETTSAVGAGADAVPDNAEEGSPPKDETEQRVRTPLFPMTVRGGHKPPASPCRGGPRSVAPKGRLAHVRYLTPVVRSFRAAPSALPGPRPPVVPLDGERPTRPQAPGRAEVDVRATRPKPRSQPRPPRHHTPRGSAGAHGHRSTFV